MFKVIILLRYLVLYINYFSTIFPFHLSPVVIFTYDPFVCNIIQKVAIFMTKYVCCNCKERASRNVVKTFAQSFFMMS